MTTSANASTAVEAIVRDFGQTEPSANQTRQDFSWSLFGAV